MISQKLQEAINVQIAAEMWSSNLYLSMSFYFKKLGYDGYGCGTGREKGVEKNINDSCYFIQDILNYIKIS